LSSVRTHASAASKIVSFPAMRSDCFC
jgi:hypothetical protein